MSLRIKDRCRPPEPPLAPGTYLAICVGVIDIGEQKDEKFGKYRNNVVLVWDVPSKMVEINGKQVPKQISKTYSFAWGDRSSLRKDLTAWNSVTYGSDEAPDLTEQLGKGCMLTISLNETGEYSNVTAVVALPEGIPAPLTDTQYIVFDMEEWDDALFEKLPEWAQNRIKKSTQYQKEHAPNTTVEVKAPAAQECPI